MAKQFYETDRLILRNWVDSDNEIFAQINSDKMVMKYFHALRTREESDTMVNMIKTGIKKDGFGFWAVERKDTNQFIGFVGLNRFSMDLPFCPCVEIGWRLAKEHWGHGFATEAAMQSLSIGFDEIALAEIVAFTAVENVASRRVMEKIGMTNTIQNFLHPSVPNDSDLQEHCLYTMTSASWGRLPIAGAVEHRNE